MVIDWCLAKVRKHLIFHYILLLLHGSFPQTLFHMMEKGFKPTYLKTIHNQLSAILNYAVNFYD